MSVPQNEVWTTVSAFSCRDYRDTAGEFDRIVSVGMFEHVGVGFYRTFFAKCRELLRNDGAALLHTIGRLEPPGGAHPWIRKYIFPGGYIPALSEVSAAVEKERLLVCDVEMLRNHYARTLRHWRERFLADGNRAAEKFGKRFCRMWEFYLPRAKCRSCAETSASFNCNSPGVSIFCRLRETTCGNRRTDCANWKPGRPNSPTSIFAILSCSARPGDCIVARRLIDR